MSLSFHKHHMCLTFQVAKFIKLSQIDHSLGPSTTFLYLEFYSFFIPVWLLEQKEKYVA